MAGTWQSFANLCVWVAGALGLLVLNDAIPKLGPRWHLSGDQQTWLFIAGAVLLVLLGYLADRKLQRLLRRMQS